MGGESRLRGGHQAALDRALQVSDAVPDDLDDLIAARLVRRYQDGDLEAFVLLYDRYRERVRRIAVARLGDEHDAADVSQQVFFQVLRVIGAYRPDARSFRRWISKVAQNAAEDHRRREQRAESAPPDALDRWLEAVQDHAPGWGSTTAVHDLIAELTELEQQVLMMIYQGRLRSPEVAVALGRSEGSIRTVHSRALGRLRKRLPAR